MKKLGALLIALCLLPLMLCLLLSPIPQAQAISLEVYGIDLSTYIPTNSLLGFQSLNYAWTIYINVTSGNLNGTACEMAIYDDFQGYFKFTALEPCTFHIYSTGGSVIFKKNNIAFGGYASISPMETVILSWLIGNIPTVFTITIQNGIYGSASPSGTYQLVENSQLILRAIPMNSSFSFSYWQSNTRRIALNPYYLTVRNNDVLTPVFIKHGIMVPIGELMSFILPMSIIVAIAGFTIVLARSRRN